MLVDEMDDREGDAERGGDTVDTLDCRRGRVMLVIEGNGVDASDNTMLSLGVLLSAILRSVCLLF